MTRPERRLLVAAAAAALSASSLVTPAATAGVGAGGFSSANVTWVANVPIESTGIGGRVLTVGGQRRFYLTTLKGLSIYDVTNPALPVVLGTLPFPHYENESVAVSDDGSLVLVATDPGYYQPLTYVIDTSLPTAPRLVSVIPQGTHTASCVNPSCTYVYGSAGWTYDLTDRAAPKPVVPGWGDLVRAKGGPGRAHYIGRDAAGLLHVDGMPRAVLDPRTSPRNPALLATAGPLPSNYFEGVPHNSTRPNATAWTPRGGTSAALPLRPGELLISTGETLQSQCTFAAGIATWNMANFDTGRPFTVLDYYRPVTGTVTDGNGPAHALGCSAHWFDYRDHVLASAWYENGVHFLRINEQNGDITEVGWYHAGVTEAWAAYWIDDEHVYSVDAVRGIDILRFDRAAPPAAPAEVAAAWQAPTWPASDATRREQYVCRIAAG